MRRSDSFSFWCITAVMVVVAGLHGYLIVEQLLRGVAVSYSRVGPSTTYTLAGQPKMYWFTLIWNAMVEVLFIAIALGAAWVAREWDRNERSRKRSR